jgi:BirA family biotin operon repressor/biotin-[acetyl-CoA-carboxylase] ligase
MLVLTDNTAFAQQCLPETTRFRECRRSTLSTPPGLLADELFGTGKLMCAETQTGKHWDYLFAVECASHSQYDVLSRLAVSGCELPGKVLCCAGSGQEFHGFKNRSWKACRGNIHLSALVKPGLEVEGGAAGFIVASVLAALQTAASFELKGATPAIKWVNDILIDGAKVGGVLARLQNQGPVTQSAIVGIGLNVEKRPSMERDLYVPDAGALSDFVSAPRSCVHADAFPVLIDRLWHNLEALCNGGFAGLLELYRQHSSVIGKPVTIFKETRKATSEIVARGLVESIGPGLELYIEGHHRPVTNGRLVMGIL